MKRSNQLNKLRYAAIGRHGFNLVCIAAIWARVIVAKNALNVQAPMFLMMEQYSAIAWGIFFIGMGLILHAQFGLGGKQRESLWFISRLILFPLSMFSFVSYVGATVMHGLEFATFQNRIAKNVENKITRAILVRRSTLLILFISTLLIPRSLTFYSKDVVVGLGLVGVVATAVYGTMVFVHALIDEQMYSFRNPLVVRHIVPMLEDRSAVPEKGAS